jgi:hypothetical protein
MSIKNSNDTIGNRTRDLPACSAMFIELVYPSFLILPNIYFRLRIGKAVRSIAIDDFNFKIAKLSPNITGR